MLAGAIVGVLALTGCAKENVPRFANSEAIVANIRDGLRTHAATIRVGFRYDRDILDELPSLTDEWMLAAKQETPRADEGDYITYQTGGYESHCSFQRENGTYIYQVEIIPKYYSYLTQEEAVTQKTKEILTELKITDAMTDLEKTDLIYDYICRSVSYDKVHKKNPYFLLRSTAYAALINGAATCQGYSVSLYRLLREAGVSARIVTGQAGSDTVHAWNIIRIDGSYYYADATWDSEYAARGEPFQYYLKGTESFSDHIIDETFLTKEFMEDYPVSTTDYRDPEKKEQ